MNHRTEVLNPENSVYVALCACGWIGTDRSYPAQAKRDCDQHRVTFFRKQNPQQPTPTK